MVLSAPVSDRMAGLIDQQRLRSRAGTDDDLHLPVPQRAQIRHIADRNDGAQGEQQ